MLSKSIISHIHSLAVRKYRTESGEFLAEGPKLVGDLAGNLHCSLLVATEEWMASNPRIKADRKETVTPQELKSASLLQNPQQVLALFRIPEDNTDVSIAEKELCLALDDVQDPGNLGTIVRLADWFGISHIFCSKGTADIYNPKAVQATMGALARVSLHYIDLQKAVDRLAGRTPVYGTFLNGKNIYTSPLQQKGLIIMGNEGKGISPTIEQAVTEKLTIPNYPEGRETSESLNVAIATAIICSEFRKRAMEL